MDDEDKNRITQTLEKWFGGRYQPILDEPTLKSLDWLWTVASKSPNVQLMDGGQILARKEGAKVFLDVAATVYDQDSDHPHLELTVRVEGHKRRCWHPCVEAHKAMPVADSCVAFVLMVDSGWPDECVPYTLQYAIDEVDLFLANVKNLVKMKEIETILAYSKLTDGAEAFIQAIAEVKLKAKADNVKAAKDCLFELLMELAREKKVTNGPHYKMASIDWYTQALRQISTNDGNKLEMVGDEFELLLDGLLNHLMSIFENSEVLKFTVATPDSKTLQEICELDFKRLQEFCKFYDTGCLTEECDNWSEELLSVLILFLFLGTISSKKAQKFVVKKFLIVGLIIMEEQKQLIGPYHKNTHGQMGEVSSSRWARREYSRLQQMIGHRML